MNWNEHPCHYCGAVPVVTRVSKKRGKEILLVHHANCSDPVMRMMRGEK